MTDQEFDIYHEEALDEFEVKQGNLQDKYGLGKYERYLVDFETSKIQFLDGDIVKFEATFTVVGSHVPEKNHWKWAWANEVYPEWVRQKSESIKRLFEMTGYDVFKNATVSADTDMAWEFLALACRLLAAPGGYTVSSRNVKAYLAFEQVGLVAQVPDKT
jgi:hypothetical protein